MKSANSERTELLGHLVKQRQAGEIKTRILAVDDHLGMRHTVTELINQEYDLAPCLEAGSTEQAWDIVNKQQVDLVILQVSQGRPEEIQLIEKIKLQCPTIPILVLSARNEARSAERTSQREGVGYSENQEARDKIIKAVRYVQSLLRTQVHGFTILVKV